MKSKIDSGALEALEVQVKIIKWLLAGLGTLGIVFLMPFYEQGKVVAGLVESSKNHENIIFRHTSAVESIHSRISSIDKKVGLNKKDMEYIKSALREIKKLVKGI